MKTISRLTVAAAAAALAVTGLATAAGASTNAPADDVSGAFHAVFVQTDNPAGNQIIAYHRDAFGRLTRVGEYPTGGVGGVLAGSVADHLASQGSLAYDARHGLLLVVNAGSSTISVFDVRADRLALRQIVPSGGAFPVSIAVHGDVVYALNALDGGSIQGFILKGGRLPRVPAWHRALGLDPNATPQFTYTPGQVGFASGGSKLVVTTKAAGQSVEVFPLTRFGAPAAAPTITPLPGTVPFAFVVDPAGRLILVEAGTSTVATLSGIRVAPGGGLNATGVASTDPGTVDAAVSSGGRHLYAQTGVKGIVDEFAIGRDGTLTRIGAQTVPDGTGAEGIVAF